MPAFETTSYTGSAGAITFGTLSPVGSDPTSVKYFSTGTARLLNLWGQADWATATTTASALRIFANDWHDTTNGITEEFRSLNAGIMTGSTGTLPGASVTDLLMADEAYQPLNSQASLTIQGSGSNVGMGKIDYYTSLDGINQKLITPQALTGHILNYKTLIVPVTSGFTYATTSTAFNSFDTTLHGNTYYAIVGYNVSRQDALTVSVKGNFSGNLHLGGPGSTVMPWATRNFFVRLARVTGLPLVPLFSSADQANCFVECANSAGLATSPVVSLNLVETDFTS